MLFALFLLTLCVAAYNPESNDWQLLKAEMPAPAGSYDTLPFLFGLVASPYIEPDLDVDSSDSDDEPLKKRAQAIEMRDGPVEVDREVEDADEGDTADVEKRELEESDEETEQEETDDTEAEAVADIDSSGHPVYPVTCASEATLLLTLENGILRDSHDRIGSIVASHQLQFDGPMPQYGTLYAAGWLVTPSGQLNLNSPVFYQCVLGEYYNLYDESIGDQCAPVVLNVIELINC